MNIGQAITALKSGKMVRRSGWNGKGMHIYLEDMWSFPIRAGIYKGQKRSYGECLVLYIASQELHQPGWNASTPDLLAEDWEIVEK
jgi:Protein of unknown function (DUF2829)